MQLTLCAQTALRILRDIRCGRTRHVGRCDLLPPRVRTPGKRTGAAIREGLEALGLDAWPEDEELHVLVPSRTERFRAKGVRCSYRMGTIPRNAFLSLGNGVATSGPELLFVEMARVLEPADHLLLGLELCGRFSLPGTDGPVSYGIPPATSVARLRAFLSKAEELRGAAQARETLGLLSDEAWSPMEAIVVALLVLPFGELGYGLGPVELNARHEASGQPTQRASRVPDVLFSGTHVGINYDGRDHFGLEEIARSAREAERTPGDQRLAREAEKALAEARRRIVEDKRRDRDLAAMGLTVVPVTYEDLMERGGLDLVVRQLIELVEREGARDCSIQRHMLESTSLVNAL